MSANMVVGKCKILITKPESQEIITSFSLDFNAFIAMSLRK